MPGDPRADGGQEGGRRLTVLSIDFETRATVDLRKTGVYPYAEHPDTGIWCMAWAFDDEEPEIWYPLEVKEVLDAEPPECVWCGQPCTSLSCMACGGSQRVLPSRVEKHILAGGEIRAHNAEFERIIWREIMHKRWGFPNPKMEQWVCSAAEAAAMSLPRSLDQACQVTGVKQQKDGDGYSLMMRMTRPRKIETITEGRFTRQIVTWWDIPERIIRLGDYCKQDVRAEKALSKVLRPLTSLEREHYLECARQNDRGIQVDVPLVQAARRVADEGIARANAALEQLTEGVVSKVTNHGRLREWLNTQIPPKTEIVHIQGHSMEAGYDMVESTPAVDSVSKKAVRELLESDLDPKVREVLTLRADAGRSSIAKLDSMLECVCTDGKIRGMHLYHGASTGRETGRLSQVHNFPRGEIDGVERFVDPILREAYEEIDLFHHPIIVISSLLRGMLTASPGHELVAADFSGIEARGVNWIAGQEDVLEHFRAMDAGDKSRDPYIQNAATYYKIPAKEVTKAQRQTGKFQELGCGFGMGAVTGQRQAKDVYGLELTPTETLAMVNNYRETHPKVKAFWRAIDNAALSAVGAPGSVVRFGPLENLIFTKQGAYLYLILPSRRPLVYAAPRIVERELPWSTEEKPAFGTAVEISALNPQTRKWARQAMYGGIWTENVVQAISRDVMAEAKLRVEAAGYPVVLTCHDEIVSEAPLGGGDLKEFIRLLEVVPEWATGWPIKAEGWRGHRYRK